MRANKTGANIGLTTVGVLAFLKPLADMLWAYQIVDLALLALAVLALLLGLRNSRIKLCAADFVACLLVSLITISFAQDTEGVVLFAKMSSAFLLYFIGRLCFEDVGSVIASLKASLAIALSVNVLLMVVGVGFQTWGNAHTFTGAYFFKTDLASAMCLALLVALYWIKDARLKWAMAAAAIMLIVASNTRAYYIIMFLVVLMYIMFEKAVVLNSRLFVVLIGGTVLALLVINWLFTTPFFSGLGFIGFRFESFADLFNEANTQGRNVIWAYLLEQIESSDPISKLIGISLTGDQVYVNGSEYGSHSLYIGMLFNTGIIGFLLLVVFFFSMLRYSLRYANNSRRFSFFVLSVQLMFLYSGVSVHVLQYTADSWIPMLLTGMLTSCYLCKSAEKPFGDALEVGGFWKKRGKFDAV